MKKTVYLLILFLLSFLLSSCGKVEVKNNSAKSENNNLKVNLNSTGVSVQTKNWNIKADDNEVKREWKENLNWAKNDSWATLEEKLKNSLKNGNNQNPSTNNQDKSKNTVDLDSEDEEALKIIDSLNSIIDE